MSATIIISSMEFQEEYAQRMENGVEMMNLNVWKSPVQRSMSVSI
jgi:hypothetical protein